LLSAGSGRHSGVAIAEPSTSGDPGRDLDVISDGHDDRRAAEGADQDRPARLPGWTGRPIVRRIAAVLAVAVVLTAATWVTNWRLGRSEFGAVLRCVQSSQQTLTAIDGRLTATAAYVAPDVGPKSSLLIRDDLYKLIEDAARDTVPDLDDVITGCDDVSIAPLYHRMAAARAAYVGYLDAQLSHLHDITRDGTAQFRPPPELALLRAAARTALSAAAPDGGDRLRVDALLPAG
jgi:hypothetical protein